MDQRRRRIAARLLERSRAHDAEQADRRARYRNLEPESAELLDLLVLATMPRRVLELGTSNGCSTTWLGDAGARVGGTLVSVDVDEARLAEAAESLEAARLRLVVKGIGERTA